MPCSDIAAAFMLHITQQWNLVDVMVCYYSIKVEEGKRQLLLAYALCLFPRCGGSKAGRSQSQHVRADVHSFRLGSWLPDPP